MPTVTLPHRNTSMPITADTGLGGGLILTGIIAIAIVFPEAQIVK